MRSVNSPSWTVEISTHAPLAGRDRAPSSPPMVGISFQPTRPLRGATSTPGIEPITRRFQPTRPLRGATKPQAPSSAPPRNFNPRAPCGARPRSPCRRRRSKAFQPTRPLRGATEQTVHFLNQVDISTHAPLAGRDKEQTTEQAQPAQISTHAPLAGRDRRFSFALFWHTISTHAPLAGRDSKSVQITMHIFAITDKFQMLLHRMLPVRAFCSFLMQENHADFGCEPPK